MARVRPTLEYRRGSQLGAHVFASQDAGWFDGHFPAYPLFPGVAILAMVEEAIDLFWPDAVHPAVTIVSYRRVRFRKRVKPTESLRILVEEAAPERLRFSVEAEGQIACSGECSVSTDQARPMPKPADVGVAWETLVARGRARLCSDGATLDDALARARGLARLAAEKTNARICVATEDRLDVAAAVLAAFSGQVQVLFPPALAPDAVLATYRATPFSHWIGPASWQPLLGDVPARHVDPSALEADERSLEMGSEGRPCVLLQTGGTTGQPRLWMKSPRNLLVEVMAHVHALQVGPDDHILATVPPHHIYGLLFSVLLPLCSGATVERVSPFFPQEIARRIAQTSATLLVSTPAHLRALTATLDAGHALRLVLSSGAPLAAADAAAFAARTKHWPLEIYGSTETGGIASRRQDRPDALWQPLPNVACRASAGCLAVQSSYVSDDAELEDDGCFLTADRVDLRSDGSFELFGRSDGIVKVGGQRVALPEVEQALLSLDQVCDAAVVAVPVDSGRGQEIVALVVCDRPVDDLARELRERLPSPAWPRRLRSVPEIPTTASGKRDRNAIVDLFTTTPREETGG